MSGIDFATVLYRQLPEVFRDRDNPSRDAAGHVVAGDLVKLLESFGSLQSALYRTMLQRYYDIFPDQDGTDEEGLAHGCQAWVLPYLAQLLDAVPISPLESGQRAELANAVAWRQRKGTLAATTSIVDAVADLDVEIQEGWRILAVTARPGAARLPALSFGESEPVLESPAMTGLPGLGPLYARHPGLPNGTVDLRCASRAVRGTTDDPTAQETRFDGVPVLWRQAQRHGVPCFPDSFQDVSARTADLRTPDWRRGHAHPRRAVLHAAPFAGLFPDGAPVADWAGIEAAIETGAALPAGLPLALVHGDDDSVTLGAADGTVVRITGAVDLAVDRAWRFENLWFDTAVQASAGRVRLVGCALPGLDHSGDGAAVPVIDASACLFGELSALDGIALEYCTVLGDLVSPALTASDCILARMPRSSADPADDALPTSGCVRFSRLPVRPPDPALVQVPILNFSTSTCCFDAPIFVETVFGQRGCGVLHPATPASIRFGAEDGGEMGACHALRYTLREQAVMDKLADFMPIGIDPVLVPDASLLCAPPSAA
jgi:hypothetical protein